MGMTVAEARASVRDAMEAAGAEEALEVFEKDAFEAGYGHGCSDFDKEAKRYNPLEAYNRWVANGRE